MTYVLFALVIAFAVYYAWQSNKLIIKAVDTIERYKDLCDMQEQLIKLLEDMNERNISSMHDVLRESVRLH